MVLTGSFPFEIGQTLTSFGSMPEFSRERGRVMGHDETDDTPTKIGKIIGSILGGLP
jgi:hypothetical protein